MTLPATQPKRTAPKTPQVRRKLQVALRAIIWDGARLPEAAAIADFSATAICRAFAQPHVLKWIEREREMRRVYASMRNEARLEAIADEAKNVPAVQAIKLLEEMAGSSENRQSNHVLPGITISIVTELPPKIAAQVIDVPASRQAGLLNEINDEQQEAG